MKSLENFSALELNNVEELKGGCAPIYYNPYSNCYNPCNPCNTVTKKTKKSKKSIKCGTKKKK